MANYRSEQIQRVLKIMLAMVGHEAQGIKPNELVKGLGESSANVIRALANLELAGLAERHPIDKTAWRLTAKFAQSCNTVLQNLTRAQQQLSQDFHNYSITR